MIVRVFVFVMVVVRHAGIVAERRRSGAALMGAALVGAALVGAASAAKDSGTPFAAEAAPTETHTKRRAEMVARPNGRKAMLRATPRRSPRPHPASASRDRTGRSGARFRSPGSA